MLVSVCNLHFCPEEVAVFPAYTVAGGGQTSQTSLLISQDRTRGKKRKKRGTEKPLGLFVDNYFEIGSLPMLKMTGTNINPTMKAHFKLNCLVFHTTCNDNWRLDWPYLLAFVTLHWTPANWLLMSFSSLTVGGRIHTLTRPPWGQVIALWCLLTRRLARVIFCMCLHTTN